MKNKLLTSLLLSASVLFPVLAQAELVIHIDSDATADGTRLLVAPFGP